MTYKYDFCIFIGRFQPVHSGHFIVIQRALQEAKKLIIVLGSHNCSRTLINPFTSTERRDLILATLPEDQRDRIIFTTVEDHGYSNNAWLAETQAAIDHATLSEWKAGPSKIALIGHKKDGTSFYLKMFPEFDFIDVPDTNNLSATDLRDMMYMGLDWKNSPHIINNTHESKLIKLHKSSGFQSMVDEFNYIQSYMEKWGENITALTTDAVVTMGGHILMIQRGNFPGKGLWALPGGFLNPGEYMVDGMLRELREETKLKVPEPVLRGSIVGDMIADDPYRDPRGRIVSRAFHIDIKTYGGGGKPEDIGLPAIKGADDAKHAEWIKLGTFAKMRARVFADHYDIVEKLIGGF